MAEPNPVLDFQGFLLWMQARLGRHMIVSFCLGSSHIPAATIAGYLAGTEDLNSGKLIEGTELADAVAFRLTRDPGDPAGDANGRFLAVSDGFKEARWVPYGQLYLAVVFDDYRLEVGGDVLFP